MNKNNQEQIKILRPWVRIAAASIAGIGFLNIAAWLMPRSWYVPVVRPKPYEVHFDLAKIYARKHGAGEEA